MKKWREFLATLFLVFGLAACGSSGSDSDDPQPEDTGLTQPPANDDGQDDGGSEDDQGDGGESDEGLPSTTFGESQVFLRGEMNGWAASEDSMFTIVDNCYQLTTNLGVDSFEFKIGDENWEFVNIGSPEAEAYKMTIGTEKVLSNNPADGGPKHLIIDVAEAGDYQFKLCVYETQTGFPNLTITKI